MIEREKTLLHFLPFAILILDEKNEVVYLNPKAEEVFNRRFGSDEKLSIKDILSEENLKVFSFVAGKVRAKRESASFLIQEEEKFLELSLSPIHKDKDVIGLIVTVVDQTESMKSTFTKLSFVQSIFGETEKIIENLKISLNPSSPAHDLFKKLEENLFKIKREITSFSEKRGRADLKYVVKGVIDEIKVEFLKRGVRVNYRSTPSSLSVFFNREEFENFLLSLLKEMAGKAGDIWVTVEEGKIDETRYGVCLLTFSGEIDRKNLQPLEDFIKKEDGIFEILGIEGVGTTIGIALPSII
jgi:hypothetical protein